MKYKKQPVVSGVTRFTKAPMSEVEFSRMKSSANRFTTFNAGDIIPLYYAEVLPHDTYDVSIDYVMRQLALLKPAFGDLNFDVYAFFVPNRVVNESWKNVQGENTSGVWSAPEVELAPLVSLDDTALSYQVPVGSVADYYGFPTQDEILTLHLKQMNDLKFRGYLEIYNNYFRDQNYQPPIPYSKLNVFEGFFEPVGTAISFDGEGPSGTVVVKGKTDGSYPEGAIRKDLLGDNGEMAVASFTAPSRLTAFSALGNPLKANKFHDAFTSVMPSPQKGVDVVFGLASTKIPISTDTEIHNMSNPLKLGSSSINADSGAVRHLLSYTDSTLGENKVFLGVKETTLPSGQGVYVNQSNLIVDLSNESGISVNDLRMAVATQQVYETLARGGSRYLEVIRSFFDIESETPFADIPVQLGHMRSAVDMYQVAQTSASVENETPQGNLSAFSYTAKGDKLFHRTFLEHGYIHILGVVRQKNTYTTYLAPDNFRKSTLDFYLPQFANIGEQPIPLRTLNPFIFDNDDGVIGYQEAWWEYRYEMDCASGYFRQGLPETLTGWTYADKFDPNFTHVNGDWLKSNAQEVVDSTLSVTSALAHQFFGVFTFTIDKQRPMPIYSMPGLDII